MSDIMEGYALTTGELLLLLAGVGCRRLEGFAFAREEMPDRMAALHDLQRLYRKGMLCRAQDGESLRIAKELRLILEAIASATHLLRWEGKDIVPACAYGGAYGWQVLAPDTVRMDGWRLFSMDDAALAVYLREQGRFAQRDWQDRQEKISAYWALRNAMIQEGIRGECVVSIVLRTLPAGGESRLEMWRGTLEDELLWEDGTRAPYSDGRLITWLLTKGVSA